MHIRGSVPALVTPFQQCGALDLLAFEDLLRWQLHEGSEALVVGGSTGESGALEETELAALLECALRTASGRVPVIAGTGAPATAKALKMARLARSVGADAVLAVTPYYSRPTQVGLATHFRALADGGGLPVIVYNVPTRTGVDLLPDTVAALAAHPRIVGIKEAVAEEQRMRALLALRRPGFAVLSGDDATALRALAAGADGVISVVANLVPRLFAELVRHAREGRLQAAGQIDAMLAPLYAAAGSEPNPIPVKAGLALMGRMQDVLRLPLLPLSESLRPALVQALASAGVAPGAVLAA
ncbi:MAG: 4-hydroxy-tetrahydrodipicolinate synthase [Xanthomonadales bacterium]|nr:4-hydroxy-tetrahydrodipicolinate synthase [Xanthomonadales bacterium]MCC6593484.1 4-hydroxy-tetrahydrodipicolinate synthase [Xanthomonadales bacterium]MCE7929899.1 4-hydroxy-tetrahydrodipicolinate synthase [Xanthomonadales bacterium PRO6]